MVVAFDDQIEIFFGEATPSQARVYARLSRGAWPTDAKLHGTISGPTCLYAQTLPSTYRFSDRGPGDSFVAEATVPDPCFWTPQLPYLYQIEIRVQRVNEVLAEASQPFGIRPLGVRGKSLIYAGKRCVLRGGLVKNSPALNMEDWHNSEAAMLFDKAPADDVLTIASRLGVMVIVGPIYDITTLRRLARHAAVGLVIRSVHTASNRSWSASVPNLPIAGIGMEAVDFIAQEAKVVVTPSDDGARIGRLASLFKGPIIAIRLREAFEDPIAVRQMCDQMQRDLAPYGDFAGYIA